MTSNTIEVSITSFQLGHTLMPCYNLFTSLVRSHLVNEYASPVWNPFLMKHIEQWERVQKFALQVCFKQWNHNVSYYDLLQLAALPGPNLAARRKYLSLCYFYKVVHNIFEFPNSSLTARILSYTLIVTAEQISMCNH